LLTALRAQQGADLPHPRRRGARERADRYLLGVEALKAGKEALMFLTKDAIHIAIQGFAATIDVPGAPSIAALHQEYAADDGRMHVCPACVKVGIMQDAEWIASAETAGASAVFVEGGGRRQY